MRELSIATAPRRTATQWANKAVSWSKIVERCRTPQVTQETVAEYARMTKDQQSDIKDVGGFVGGYLIGGKRNKSAVKYRDLLTLDIDTGRVGVWDKFVEEYPGRAAFSYSTHKHTDKTPRLRLVMPFDRSVSPEEYGAISRAVAAKVGLEFFDPTTYAPERLMYWPSRSKDGDWFFQEQQGEPLCVDDVLGTYIDWRDTSEWPESTWENKGRDRECKKQGDPTEKPGVIGAFCRTYDIHGAIEQFLSDVYEPAGDNRYTYKQGSVSAGLVLYGDSKFAYSHNATDPCSQHLVNAFDLVRMHLFAERDEDSKPGTPVNKLPSFIAMQELATKDTAVRSLIVEEKTKSLQEDFKDISTGDVEQAEENGESNWRAELEVTRSGKIITNSANLVKVLEESPYFKGLLWYNEFNGKLCAKGKLPWGSNPRGWEGYEWQNEDDCQLRVWLDRTLGMQGKEKIYDALVDVAMRHSKHPVKDYLTNLKPWDGIPRVDTLFVDFLGARDTKITRAFTRKHLVAAVARIMREKPEDSKYDQILTLVGREGLGKSTLLRRLGGAWFNDSIGSLEGKDGMEALQGSWIVEVAELVGVKRSENEAVKSFLSREEDKFRPAYARHSKTRARECVFFATTNEKDFLKGDTGNRRYWVVETGVIPVTHDVWDDFTEEYRAHVWAEALHYYHQGEPRLITKELLHEARQIQEDYNENSSDDRIGIIKEFLEKRLPADWKTRSIARRQAYFKDCDPLTPEGVLRRDTVSNVEIYVECFGLSLSDPKLRYKTREITSLMSRVEGWEKGGYSSCGDLYGKQRIYKRIIENGDDEDL